MTQYTRDLYSPRGLAYLGDDNDDNDDYDDSDSDSGSD